MNSKQATIRLQIRWGFTMTVGPIPLFNYLPTFDTPDQVEDFFQSFQNAGASDIEKVFGDPNCNPTRDPNVKKELETALKALSGLASDSKARQALEKVLTALGEFARDPAKAQQDLTKALGELAGDTKAQKNLQDLATALGKLARDPNAIKDIENALNSLGGLDPHVKNDLKTVLEALGKLTSDQRAQGDLEKVLTALGEFARDPTKAQQDLQGALSDLAQDHNAQSSLQSLVSALGDLVRRLKNQEDLQEVEEILRHHRFDPWGIGSPSFGPPYRYV